MKWMVGMIVDMIVKIVVKMIDNMPKCFFFIFHKEPKSRQAFGITAIIRSEVFKKKNIWGTQ